METKTGELLTENIAGVNRILPHKHKFAWDLFLKSCANNWMPTEISMQSDIKQWKNDEITDDEKLLVKRCLGFFAGSESLVGNNLLLSAFRYITDAECRQYILRQAFEESLHNLTVVYICDSLDLDIEEVFAAYETIPSIKAKDDFLMQITNDISRQDFDAHSIEGRQEILRNFLTYWIVCEGTFFFSGFAMLLALGRQNKLQGISDQIKYTLRDESSHIAFGTYLINTLIEQNPEIWTEEIQQEFVDHMKKAVELEIAYAHDVLTNRHSWIKCRYVCGLYALYWQSQTRRYWLDYRFPSDKNPFPWLSEVVDVQAMGNFFERRVREYQQSGALEDDF